MKTLLRIIIKLFALTLFRIAIFFAATAGKINKECSRWKNK